VKIERLVHRRAGAALRNHRMIEDGDRVLIAVSGGIDSSVLGKILAEKKRSLPINFELVACHISTDLVEMKPKEYEWLENFFEKLKVTLYKREVSVLGRLKPGKPLNCFFCAMQRRMMLIRVAKNLGCTKIAYGHHMDDIIETLLLNMFYKAEISTMPSRLEMDNHDITIIRPLCETTEAEVKRYAKHFDIIQTTPKCPYDDKTRRSGIKNMITEFAKKEPRIRNNIYASLGRVKSDYLKEKLRQP